jgi:hypothetical protein
MRQMEVSHLIEKGARLEAAKLLVSTGQRERAVEILKELPAPKGYGFMVRAGLKEEAQKLADENLAAADKENKLDQRAKWLDIVGKQKESAEAWEKAGRPGKASFLWEKLGELSKAAPLAEAAKEYRRATALYEKLGDSAAAARNAALAKEHPESPKTPEPSDVAEAEEAPQSAPVESQ